MKILHRFMLRQFIGPFLMSFLIVVFTLLMQFLWKYIDDLVGKGLDFSVIGELLLYTSAQLSIMAFPLAVLLASIFTFGNLGENYELIAIKSAGVSLPRMMAPLIILSLLIAIGAFFFANNVTPITNLKMRTLIYDIQQQRPELQIAEGVFYNGIEGYSIRIGRRDPKTRMLYDVRIHDHTEQLGNLSVIMADSGMMAITFDHKFMEVKLYNGIQYKDETSEEIRQKKDKTYPFTYTRFEEQVFRMELPGFDLNRSDEQIFKQSYQMMNLSQLEQIMDSLQTIVGGQSQELFDKISPSFVAKSIEEVPIDTAQRTSVPEFFMSEYAEQSKADRLRVLQIASNDAQYQRDQVAGLVYELEDKSKRSWKYEIEWHRKFTMSLACLIFFFIGAPLGAIIRKGGIGTPIIIAVIFFVLYYVISMIGEKSAREGAMTPLNGMWTSTFIVLPIGIILTYLSTKDSSVFSSDLYMPYIRKAMQYLFAPFRKPRVAAEVAASADLSPEKLLGDLNDFSASIKDYLDNVDRTRVSFWRIWQKQEDAKLLQIATKYDTLRAHLLAADIYMIKESAQEYPNAYLLPAKIERPHKLLPLACFLIFPVHFYLFLKYLYQKSTLRAELLALQEANRNLINELNTII